MNTPLLKSKKLLLTRDNDINICFIARFYC